ncbi:BON domain-containing protein [Hydrogenophaga sp. R2]|uniref:BON domain-containing protein n=1 Tax=Hydrogenophaga sp. R2 TaxID=3132827 RepID=UPI003CF055A2
MQRKLRIPALTAALLATAVLAACGESGEPTLGQRVDNTVNQVGQAANQMGQDAKQAAQEVQAAGEKAADVMARDATDAAITAKVNAALAADDRLSALGIDVDTTGGRVELSGTAPDEASRERATVLAKAVEGVVEVENRLTIRSQS